MDGSERVSPDGAGDEQAVDVTESELVPKPTRAAKPDAPTKPAKPDAQTKVAKPDGPTKPAKPDGPAKPDAQAKARPASKGKMPPTLVEPNRIVVSDRALASLVGLAAHEVPGVVGMAPVSLGEGLRRVLGLTQVDEGVVVDHPRGAGRADVDVHVVVAYGVNIPVVAESVRERARYAAKHLAGIELDEVRVYVQGVSRG